MPKRPPRKWFYAMVARLKKEYPTYSAKRIAKIAAGIWNKQYSWIAKTRLIKKEHHSPTTYTMDQPKGNPETSKDESYQGWANWDTWETWLILSNDQQLYRWMDAWGKNWQKKKAKGTFDMDKARKVVKKYIVPVVRGTRHMFKNLDTTDPDIDPKKVNADEIINAIFEMNEEHEKYLGASRFKKPEHEE